jgi:hypothetical protein
MISNSKPKELAREEFCMNDRENQVRPLLSSEEGLLQDLGEEQLESATGGGCCGPKGTPPSSPNTQATQAHAKAWFGPDSTLANAETRMPPPTPDIIKTHVQGYFPDSPKPSLMDRVTRILRK